MKRVGGKRGSLMAHERHLWRGIIARSVVEYEGVVEDTAWDLGYHRSHMYRLIKEYRVWPVVNRARVERLERRRKERG